MADRFTPSAMELVTVHLLDSAQGHPVQTWRFRDKSSLTIGRSDDSDVVIADAHVSRLHAKLSFEKESWTLVSVGRHGTLVNDRLVAETELGERATFRLGANGPMIRFECGEPEGRPSETIDSIEPDLIAFLEIDEQRKLQEADDIAGNALFRELQEQVRRARQRPTGESEAR